MITIVDYGLGNLASVRNMFKYLNIDAQISAAKKDIENADKILLPGVGAFDIAMQKIADLDLLDVLNYKAIDQKVPFLGICLGMQLLTRGSEEGQLKGLGWIEADTIKFPKETSLKIPHMGWNLVNPSTPSPLTNDLPDESRFYFVHSYYVKVDDDKNSLLKTDYGSTTFDSSISVDNIFGTQFHPEKSHKFGMKLFTNFSNI